MPAEHTDKRYEEELKRLREQILYMGGLVEDQIQKSVKSLVERDSQLAQSIIERDHEVNRLDVDIDDLCIKLLALHQPAGRDLRFITTGLKITTDLERIGDMAVNICERAIDLIDYPSVPIPDDVRKMTDVVRSMVEDAIAAFVDGDPERAQQVIERDNEVDDLYHAVFQDVLERMTKQADLVHGFVHVQSVAKWLERMADHATNLAELVVFMVKGKDIRHVGKQKPLSNV